MPIDDRTTNRSYHLPNQGNPLIDDVARLRLALQAIDADIFARYTKSEVDALLGNLINSAPAALNTLQELAAAMGNDPNFAASITTLLGQKANLVDVYSKAQADARFVQGSVQTEMVFTATANQSVFTLTTPVINKPSALVSVAGVVQPTAEYSLNQAGTQLTLSEGVPAGTTVRVLVLGVASEGAPADDTVTEPKLRTGAVSTRALAVGIAPVVTSINGGQLGGVRNAIMNGKFDIWQRGTSHSTAGYGSADRWVNVIAGSACTMSRQKFALGAIGDDPRPVNFCRMNVVSAAGAGNYAHLSQRIEGVRTFAGQEVTIGFWAKANAAKTIAIECEQFFGTGGSPSATVNGIGVVKKSLTTGWRFITHTLTLPGVNGKTLGTADDCLILNIWFDAGDNFNGRTDSLGQQSGIFDIALVQMEPGPVATPFEDRPLALELSMCQRYYLTAGAAAGGAIFPNTSATGFINFSTEMRRAPSVNHTALSAVNVAAPVFTPAQSGTIWTANSTIGAGPDPYIISFFITADAEL